VSDPALLVRARRLRAARGVVVARDVTLTAAPGDVVAVEGPNGSGKSTLLAVAAGLLPADKASVRPGSVGYSPERAGSLPRVPLRRWLLGLARTAGLDREESARRAGDLIGRLGLTHASAVSLHALSRGNAQRALVAQARLLTSSQWFLAPAMLFLVVLGIAYATDAGPPLQAAAVTAITLVPLMTWLGVLAQRVDGRELARAFAAHIGGRARAHLAADLGLAPFAVLLSLAALVAPLISQGEHPHPARLDGKIVLLHLAAAVLGAGIGSLLALIERAGWRLLAAVAVYLLLFVVRGTPLTPLLRLSTHPATLSTPVGGPALWLFLPGAALMAAAALLAARLT
jgi:hypothetical protein